MKYRMAIVGCGQIMTHHIHALKDINEDDGFGLEIVALCDPDKNRRDILQKLILDGLVEDSVKEYDTMSELLRVDPDAVDLFFISVPHDMHESLAMEAIEAGKHVVMEKPLAPTKEACHRLLQAATRAKTLFMISEQSPYWEEVAMAKKLILEDNAIGTVISAASYYYESMRDNITSGLDSDGNLGWRCSLARAGGGIVVDGGLHWMRPLRETCGDVQR